MILSELFESMEIADDDQRAVWAFLALLKEKSPETYEHCLRVGLLARDIGRFMHLDGRALLFAGLLHDVGKCLTDPKVLSKTQSWGPADAKEMEAHVTDGFKMLRGRFDFSAQIVAWHHRFQRSPYPLPAVPLLHAYSVGTQVTILMYGRVLALADTFDALHRVNAQDCERCAGYGHQDAHGNGVDDPHADKCQACDGEGKLVTSRSPEEIHALMLERNPDMKPLLTDLYAAGILK